MPDDTDAPGVLRAILEGALLGSYRFAGYKTKPQPTRRDPVKALQVTVPDAADSAARAEVERAEVVSKVVRQTRDWVNTAPNKLRPPDFADAVAAAADGTGLEVEVLDFDALKAGGYGGIVAVGQGSEAPPRLVKLTYTPQGVANPKRVALVGKGITFDTGGISIKAGRGHVGDEVRHGRRRRRRRHDAGGRRAPAAGRGHRVPGHGGEHALRYGVPAGRRHHDVQRQAGRGAQHRRRGPHGARRRDRPRLRRRHRLRLRDVHSDRWPGGRAGQAHRRRDGLAGDLRAGQGGRATRSASSAWPMPLPDDVRKGMESEVADISQVNASMDRAGHMLQGGVFLREFVADGVEWAHIDIAGPSYHVGEPSGYWTKGGTGVPVRTLLTLIDDIAANG
nr:hypothetical protein GCM10020092_087510 [Actinoplanes digitatis]